MRCLKLSIFLLVLSYFNNAVGLTPQYSAIVIEAISGRVLEQEDADRVCHPASLTKIMTLYIVFEALREGRLSMNTQVPVSTHAARQAPSKLGLRAGESISVATIIKGLVTKSANDASAAIAEYLGGSESNFAHMMTRKAKSLGMHHTVFKNASGLPNPYQVTTARDMATLSRALYLHFPKDYRHFRLQSFHHRGHIHRNHNHLLGKVPGLDGIKTGWVAASGFNLAASAVRMGSNNKPKRLITVVLGGPNRYWRDRRVVSLLETNFQRLGLGNHPIENEIEQDAEKAEADHEEDGIVSAFLKEEMPKKKTNSLQPIQINWPLRQTNSRHKNSSSKDVWGVQLGTYKSLKEARIKAGKTLTALKSGEVSIPRLSKGKKSSYGARIFGLTKEEAEIACKKYAPKENTCRILAGDK